MTHQPPKRVLVAYATKRGSTARLAERLASGIEGAEVEVSEVGQVTSLNYDLVILGTPVRFGRIHPGMAKFLEANRERLSDLPKALFVVCLLTFLARRYLTRFKRLVGGEVLASRTFTGKFLFVNGMERSRAAEAGRNIFSLLET